MHKIPKITQMRILGFLYLLINALSPKLPIRDPMRLRDMNNQAWEKWIAPAMVNWRLVLEEVNRTVKADKAVEI